MTTINELLARREAEINAANTQTPNAGTAIVAKVRRFIEREFVPLTRKVQPKQLAWVETNVHRGAVNVPKNGVFVVVEAASPYGDNYVRVRVVGGRTAYMGGTYTASKASLERLDIRALMGDHVDFYRFSQNAPERRALAFVVWLTNNSRSIDQYYEIKRGNVDARLRQRMATGETRMQTRSWTWGGDSYRYNRVFWSGIRKDLKKVGRRIGAAKQDIASLTTEQQAIDLHHRLGDAISGVSNRFRYSSDRERAILSLLRDKLAVDWNFGYADGCGHFTTSSDIPTRVFGYGQLCPRCFKNHSETFGKPVHALDRDGSIVLSFPNRVFTWADGTVRTYDEPPIIGGYHSSKLLFTKSLPHITGDLPHKSVLKVGYELEFCMAHSGKTDNQVAREMKNNIERTMTSLFGNANQPYCGFERDGSVDFEMVSGYGPMDTHRAVLRELLGDDSWRKWLSSHNNGKCGLHVHLDKPTSLMHAVRMQAFYNNPFNENLIRAVARRYGRNTGYAKVKGDKGDMVLAAKQLKNNQQYYSHPRHEALSRAIRALTSERYEVLNFLNDKTVEVRAFRGSLVLGTVLACLEFAFISWYFCRDTAASQLTIENFLGYISAPEWRHETASLRRYLWGKGFKVWMPKKQPRAHTVEV